MKLNIVIPCYGDPREPTRHPKEIAGLNGQYWPTIFNIVDAYEELNFELALHLVGNRETRAGCDEATATYQWLTTLYEGETSDRFTICESRAVFGAAGIALYTGHLIITDGMSVTLAFCDKVRARKTAYLLSVVINGHPSATDEVLRQYILPIERADHCVLSTEDAAEDELRRINREVHNVIDLQKMAAAEVLKFGPR